MTRLSNKQLDAAIKDAQIKLDGAQAVEDLVFSTEGDETDSYRKVHAIVAAAEKTLWAALDAKIKANPAPPTLFRKNRGSKY